jgi:hypothetical protein
MSTFISMFGLHFAHAFGQRYELPIPLALFVFAGAGVVLLSFFLVLRQGAKPGPELAATDRPPINLPNAASITGSLLVFAGLVGAGLLGSQEIPENILPTLFWVIVWVGVALSCGLVGDWTQGLNPFANLSKLADSHGVRKLILARTDPIAWPDRLSWWPAVVLLYLVVACELIFNQSMTIPANMALAFITYAVVCLTAGLIFGPSWLQKGEVFTVLFNTWGRLGYFRFGSPGRRGWLGGLDAPFAPELSRVVFILLLLASVSFDGLLSTPLWSRLQHQLPSVVSVGTVGYAILALLAFALVTVLLWGLFTAFAIGVSRAGNHHHTPLQTLTGLLPSLLPISFAYLLAHYLQYLLVNGQLIFPLLGNPVGSDSWPIHLPYPFNDSYEPNPHVLSTGAAWYFAVAVIVIAHVLAVVLAHRHLVKTGKTKEAARLSEYPWIAAMVAYTMLSLWLLAQPLVKEDSAAPASFATPVQQVAAK